MMQDRSHSDRFCATQVSLASMLGVRRSTVTQMAISIQQRNIINYHRGTLTVLDRKGLEKIACECYWAAPFHAAKRSLARTVG
jgi:Mn-dependent DtxR family transcriptional regulator